MNSEHKIISKRPVHLNLFPAPKYSQAEKQIYSFQRHQEEGCEILDAENITDQMMQEWIIEQRFNQLNKLGKPVKRTKFWGELKDMSSIYQLERDYNTLQKHELPKIPPIFNQNQQIRSMSLIENLKDYEVIQQKNEQFRAQNKSKVTAASIMRLIRYKMGQLSEKKYLEQELKELDESISDDGKYKKQNNEDILAAYEENLDSRFNQKKSEIQQDYQRKKEAKDKAHSSLVTKQINASAYEPVKSENLNQLKKNQDLNDNHDNNQDEPNSVTYSSSSSDNEKVFQNTQKTLIGGQVTQTMGEETNHAKCIEHHSFCKLDWTDADLQHFHRPNIQTCFENLVNAALPIIIKSQPKRRNEDDRLNPHEYFKDKEKLSLKKGKFCLFEHVDQHPLFINNFGMASRLERFFYADRVPSDKVFKFSFQNKETQHMGPHGQLNLLGTPQFIDTEKPELGLVVNKNQKQSGLLGQINTQYFKGITVIKNEMFNAPVFYQKQNENDFFCTVVKTAGSNDSKIIIRELENNLYAVGQIEPKKEVYNPQSRDFQNFIKKRCKAYIIRLIEENENVMFSDIQKLFPHIREQILKNGMKETDIEIDRNGYCSFNQSKYQPERFKDSMTPEMICQFESACHGWYRLQKVGINEILGADKVSYSTNKFNREESDLCLRKIAKLIEKEVLSTPWNLSSSFLKVKSTNEMMMLNGDGDPSFGNGGYSYIKMPLKISSDSLQGAKDNRRNLNPAIKNPKAVTRTEGDLRKLQKDVIYQKLLGTGTFNQEFLDTQSRWEMVALLRSLENQNSEDQKYQRGVRYTSDKQRQQYNINTNITFEKQMKTLSHQNNNDYYMGSEDEPDFTDLQENLNHKVIKRKNATDYTEEIIQNEKDSVNKLSVECQPVDVNVLQKIEDIPNYLNLLLLKLDKAPPREGQSFQGGLFSGTSAATLKAEELESLPDHTIEQYKEALRKQLSDKDCKTSKKCEILCLKIRSLNQLESNDTNTPFSRIVFHASEKFIKKFNRYRNKNQQPSSINANRPYKLKRRQGLTAEQIRFNQEAKSGGESTTSKPIVIKPKDLGSAVTIFSGQQVELKQNRRKAKPKVEQPENQFILKVNFTPSTQQQPILQDTEQDQQSQAMKIQLNVQDPEDIEVQLSEEDYKPSVQDSAINDDDLNKSEEYIQPQLFAFQMPKQPRQPKLKRQPSAVSRFKGVGVSREDFAYENPTTNFSSSRKRQQQSDQALNEIFRVIVQKLMDEDFNQLFHNRVTNKQAPGYSQIIRQPICLKDIMCKTRQNAYKRCTDFKVDLQLMYENSVKYNKVESAISQIAKQLLDVAEEQLEVKKDEIVNLESLLQNIVY